jgi:hypothetical protein
MGIFGLEFAFGGRGVGVVLDVGGVIGALGGGGDCKGEGLGVGFG